MQPGPLGGQYRTRDVIAEELLGETGEAEKSEELRAEVDERTKTAEDGRTKTAEDDCTETATDVEILTGPATPE
jgi:hypothetical protein